MAEELGQIRSELSEVIQRVAEKMRPEEEVKAWEQRESDRRRSEFVKSRGIPKRYRHVLPLDQARATDAVEAARDYLRDGFPLGRCLVLSGATGVGKTYGAVSALFTLGAGTWSRYYYFPAVCGALLDFNRRSETMDAVKWTPFVVLDDFGAEYAKDGGLIEAFVDEIMWHREAEILPTILTTNLTPERMREQLSDRVIDRLREWGDVVECAGPSLRGRR